MTKDRIMDSLIRLNRMRLRSLRQEFAPYHYVGVMHLIVFYLRNHPGASQEEIATFYSVDKGSVARDARRLEDMGHIVREIVPENRRQYRLTLTPEGREFLVILDDFHSRFAENLMAGLTDGEREELAGLLARLEENGCRRQGGQP